jgi:opacity protein-like surface antigen
MRGRVLRALAVLRGRRAHSTRMITLIAILIAFNVMPDDVYAQHLRVGAGPGLSFIDSPDFYTQDVSTGGLGFNVELNVAAAAKLELQDFPVCLTTRVQYTWMTGSGTVQNDQLYGSSGDYATFADILVAGFGAEWVISPTSLSPHLSTEILFTGVGQVSYANSPSGLSPSFLKNASMRIGFAVGAGLEYSFTSRLTGDLHTRYNWNTLFGRAAGQENFNTLDLAFVLFYRVF